jgi:hypothetical protein
MEFSAIQRDRLYRKLEPLVGAEEADYLMSVLPPGGWAEVATKTDLRELRAEMITREYLDQQLRLHVDARVGEISRLWFFGAMAMQAATIGGIIAAIRL